MQQQNKVKPWSYSALFLIIIVLYIFVTLFTSVISEKIEIPTALSLVMGEIIIMVPGLCWMLFHNVSFSEGLGFKKIKISTALMTVLLAELMLPLVSLVNVVSQLFTSNEMVSVSGQLLETGHLYTLFVAGLLAPFCEEFVFRGIIAKGLGEFGSIFGAATVSGLFFGLLHMNLNQFCYAFVLGIIFAVVNRISGSIWTSIIIHAVVNSQNMLLLFVVETFNNGDMSAAVEETEAFRNGSGIFYMIAVYLVLSAIFCTASIPVYMFIAKNEGNEGVFRTLFKKKEGSDNKWWLNAFSIIAVVICLVLIFALDKILIALGIA